MAYIDSDGQMCPETIDEILVELERIAAREQAVREKSASLGDDEAEWQLTHCRVMRRMWERTLSRLQQEVTL